MNGNARRTKLGVGPTKQSTLIYPRVAKINLDLANA